MRTTRSRLLPAVTNAPNHPMAQRVSRAVFRRYRVGLVVVGQGRDLPAPNRPHVESLEPLDGAIRDDLLSLTHPGFAGPLRRTPHGLPAPMGAAQPRSR